MNDLFFKFLREGKYVKRNVQPVGDIAGIGNIVRWFRPDVLIGGFHYMKRDPVIDGPWLRDAAEKLLTGNTVYYTGHCTGDGPYAFLKDIMGDRLNRLSTGAVFEI